MRKILTVLAGVLALAATSCVKQEMTVFDLSKATAPVLVGYEVTDDGVTASYTPGVLNQSFNKQMAMNHWLVLTSVDGNAVCEPLTTSIKEGTLTVTTANLTKKLMSMGYEEGDKVALEIVIRASMQEQARDNGRNGYVDSQGKIVIAEYEVFVPTGDPYARYTEKSEWGLVGSFNGWGNEPDVEMWTNGTLHVAKGVTLAAGDEVKFRKNSSWDENFGYAEGVDSYTLGEEFAAGAGGGNIVIAETGRYDLILDPVNATIKIIVSVAGQEDPYAAYTEVSPWSVIGSFNSWGGDVEMVTNGTLHVCKNITLAAGDEFKFRKDAGWDVNFGYAEGVDSYVLGEEFAVGQGGANIIIAESGAYDLFLDPENATAKIIKTQAVVIDPYAAYTEVSPWAAIGSFNSWGGDVEMVTNGTLHVCKAIALNASDEFKFRKDGGWDVNFGYAEGVSSYVLGEEFAVGQNGANIIIAEDGVYDLILDPENATAKIIASIATEQPEPPTPVEKPKAWSLIGTLDGSSWDKDFDLTNVSGDTWVIRNVAVTASDEFKIRADHDWAKSVGGPEENSISTIDETNPYGVFKPELGVAFEAKDKNIQIGVAGNYDVTFDYAANTILIEEHHAAYALIGEIDGDSWKVDVAMTEKEGVWTSPVVEITGGFKIRYDYSWDDANVYGVEEGFVPTVGTPFTAVQPGGNITVEPGKYKVQFTPATKEVLIISVQFPEHLYMTGTDFGNWGWGEGTVELWPVINKPDWDNGKSAEGQFYTIRYFTTNGFKFNAEKAWDGGQFGSLETNNGFTNDGDGNVVVPAEGFYLVHIDLKNSILNVEPAKVYGIGDAFGGWNEAMEASLFQAEGKTLKATAPKAGKLRMYVESAIATTSWWTREFNIIDGQIVPRILDELNAPEIKAGQVVTLDFNAGTGTITGEGEAPAYKTEISVPGAFSGSEWNLETAPKLLGKADGVFKGALTMFKKDDAAIEFKFGHDGSWIGGTGEGLSFTLGSDANMTIDEGTYFWTVDLENKTATAVKVEKVGLIGSFNEWSDDVVLTFNAEDHTYNGTVTLGENAELKVRFNGNWDYSLGGDLNRLQAVNDNCKVAEAGTYTAKLDLNKGTLTLTK